jgi:hypothetical protein
MSEFEASRTKVLIFDFDGVIAKETFGAPVMPYDGVLERIRRLKATGMHFILLASFNPRARDLIRRWGAGDCFHAMRHGANHEWEKWGEYSKNKMRWRTEMRKSKQIHSMLYELNLGEVDLYFFDDSENNLAEVEVKLGRHISCHLVDTETGLTDEHLEKVQI